MASQLVQVLLGKAISLWFEPVILLYSLVVAAALLELDTSTPYFIMMWGQPVIVFLLSKT